MLVSARRGVFSYSPAILWYKCVDIPRILSSMIAAVIMPCHSKGLVVSEMRYHFS